MADPRFGLGLRLEAGGGTGTSTSSENPADSALGRAVEGIFAIAYKRSPAGLALPAERSGGVTLGDRLVKVNGIRLCGHLRVRDLGLNL